ncbi:winged helix-turn-helix domain-containing protein [Yokenella regensburgei]|uniref:winged helix-turn-helix domain-containing protein n=1 Tax=Yokenella regensburgei TaxID=158877 RepID=UPI00207798D2|nr:winged helix-turn-helix domain-containing protein [Yokenella regensburgei]MDQ4429353.1 winged helix-turn-helix domain-containing protein [Yokenella regensburgei]
MSCYVINTNCIFDENNLEIENKDSARRIKMTPMRARCLSFFITTRTKSIIDKTDITTALWGERGQFVSDANLTQLLYLLRKDLREVGIENFMITIPRQGVRINDDIDILPANTNPSTSEQKIGGPKSSFLSALMCKLFRW